MNEIVYESHSRLQGFEGFKVSVVVSSFQF